MSVIEAEIQGMRDLMKMLASQSTIVDFDEQIQLLTVQETLRIWKLDGRVVGFAYVDDYNNLWFEADPGYGLLDQLENDMIEWGVACQQKRNAETNTANTLDYSCSVEHTRRMQVLREHGFELAQLRTLRYARSLDEPVTVYPLPVGFSIRSVKGECEVEDLVALHRAAFGTGQMNVEMRLAMMNTPQYSREMDFVVVAPNGELAAFCVCGLEDADPTTGYTDPIGTHPHYQRIGLGKAVVSTGLAALRSSGVRTVEFGTSSENVAMQRLAGSLGFICVSERLWFSKAVSEL